MARTFENHMGGARAVQLTDETYRLRYGAKKILGVEATGTVIVKLDDATRCPLGGPIWLIVNQSTVTFTIQDNDGSALGTVAQDQAAFIGLGDNSTAAGQWFVHVEAVAQAVPPIYGFGDAAIDAYEDYLEAVWKFEDASGNYAEPLNSRILTVTAGTPDYQVTGKKDYAVGSIADHCAYNDDVEWVPSDSYKWTFAGWFYFSDDIGGVYILSIAEDTTKNFTIVTSHLSEKLGVYSKDHLGNSIIQSDMFTGLSIGWHHIVARQNGLTPMDLVLDGDTDNPGYLESPHVGYLGSGFEDVPIGFGARYPKTANTKLFDAGYKLDEFAFWRGVYLPDSVVERLYNNGNGRFHSGTPAP